MTSNKIKSLYAFVLLSVLISGLIFSSVNFVNAYNVESKDAVLWEQSTKDNLAPFVPTVSKPLWVDQNNNCIADTLDQEITDRLANNTAKEYVNVNVILRSTPKIEDANAFVLSGGYITASPWTNALYGFGGQIPYNKISSFALSDRNILFIEKEEKCYANIAYAAKQIGARSYVWNTLGLQGDPQSSIAIMDTGIDDSHLDFSPGFDDRNFSKKIVGWNDLISPGTAFPYDDNGHGSHVAGLATGNGFFSTNESGNAVATWGANLGDLASGTYFVSGMMVNKPGLITINVKWKNIGSIVKGKLTTLRLFYGNNTLNSGDWTEVKSVSTSNQETWYTLTSNVTSIPLSGYDMYHVLLSLSAGPMIFPDNFYVVFKMSWPYSPPSDGFRVWTGIAPETKLVGVKVLDYSGRGTTTGILDAIDWVIAKRESYHIVIVSMSLGFGAEEASVNQALVNLVNSGVTTIVSAGNSESGSNNVYTPGSVDEVMTVAAMNQFDNIASYSSQGGVSRYVGNTLKPDIAAPGGSFYGVPLFSADSNDYDADKGWTDVIANDSAPMQGTSMAAPVVSGAAGIIIEAMGGFSSWLWTRSQALQPKMILLMTATETYPNLREIDIAYSPTLERGGKDVQEGYGRLNLDVAVDALLKTYQIGTTVAEALGRPPSLSNISMLGQKLAWARKVQLTTAGRYNFTLTVPGGADYDLYLYNSTGTWYGEPAIVAKSTTATIGGYEQILLAAPYNGTYYLVVKRATATTGNGTFTLRSTFTPNHDVAIISVVPSATRVYEGNHLNVTVTVKNQGLNTESFNVTLSYNSTSLVTQTLRDVAASSVARLNFTWNTFGIAPSNYTVIAQASHVQNEYNLTDNVGLYDGFVNVKILGDVNSDGSVNIIDLKYIRDAYGSITGSFNWNPDCDFNQDNKIEATDVFNLTRNYGKTEP